MLGIGRDPARERDLDLGTARQPHLVDAVHGERQDLRRVAGLGAGEEHGQLVAAGEPERRVGGQQLARSADELLHHVLRAGVADGGEHVVEGGEAHEREGGRSPGSGDGDLVEEACLDVALPEEPGGLMDVGVVREALRAGDALHDQVGQAADVEGLGDERVEAAAGGHERLRVRAGADDDDRDQAVAGVGPEEAVGLGAAEPAQVEVEEDAVRLVLVERVEDVERGVGVDVHEVVPGRAEVRPEEVGDVALVLDHQDALRRGEPPCHRTQSVLLSHATTLQPLWPVCW